VDTIFVNAIEFYAYHGASDEEQSVGHRYSVDVELHRDTRAAGLSDDLSDTVNYSSVAKRIVSVGTTEQFRLLEALAERLAAEVLKEYPIDSVKIRVRKIRPPMNVIADSVGVEIERKRAVCPD
jgi:dihydroneopterin aldolase